MIFLWLLLSFKLFVLTHTALLTDRDNVEWTRTLALFVTLYLHDVVLLRYV